MKGYVSQKASQRPMIISQVQIYVEIRKINQNQLDLRTKKFES